MASLSLTTRDEARAPAAPTAEDLLLVTTLGDPLAEDYLAYARRQAAPAHSPRPILADLTRAAGVHRLKAAVGSGRVRSIVLFLRPQLTEGDRAGLDVIAGLAAERGTEFVCVVSTFRVHLGDRDAAEAEEYALARLEDLPARVVVFRPSHVLSPHSQASALLARLGALFPVVPGWLRNCFVEGDELFAAMESERRRSRPARARVYTVLGPNRPWREVLARHRVQSIRAAILTLLASVMGLLLLGHLAVLVLSLLKRRRPGAGRWHLDTLRPGSLGELLALYNPYNYRHVKVVGYNNGVIHFGHTYPGRTVVSTVRCDRITRVGPDVIKADCGATLRKALDFLAASGQEPFVVPNYSYVCLGTAFFVPIHGSASDYSTVAETIARVVLYDPVRDRLVAASRDEPAFRQHVFDLRAEVLLLRLCLRVKPKSQYFVQREELEGPTASEILAALRDDRAANVEFRKGSAADRKVRLCRYYTGAARPDSPVLELPRDTLGRLWDRLEENPITSFLMHAATRWFAWHVELFFTAEEFETFWQTHHALPLKKIQLRYIRRDGMPNSPFRDHDCVSADMFMLRRHRRTFEAYLQRTFRIVRSNPGKHSR